MASATTGIPTTNDRRLKKLLSSITHYCARRHRPRLLLVAIFTLYFLGRYSTWKSSTVVVYYSNTLLITRGELELELDYFLSSNEIEELEFCSCVFDFASCHWVRMSYDRSRYVLWINHGVREDQKYHRIVVHQTKPTQACSKQKTTTLLSDQELEL